MTTCLEEKQEEMWERQEEKREIKAMVARTDLVCRVCKTNPVTASKRTGIILICKSCYDKKRYLDRKRRKLDL